VKKKLIEVALPLEAINRESAREKSIRHGHPSTLHLWWARRPLAACRAVLFGSLVDDPSAHPEEFPTDEEQAVERERLFAILEQLVRWESTTDEKVLSVAAAEIRRSADGDQLAIRDPFSGGGSIPLEAQRLGLAAEASDLNPVAVMISKALIEFPPLFAGQSPVNPDADGRFGASGVWQRALGLADDVRFYGDWVQTEAKKRIGHLYPQVTLPAEHGGGQANVIVWLWARTVRCPNPACGATMPLASSFTVSTKRGREAWVEPEVDPSSKRVSFRVRTGSGTPPEAPKLGRGARFRCVVCGDVPPEEYVKGEGAAGRMGAQVMTVVAEGKRRRIYLDADAAPVPKAERPTAAWLDQDLPANTRWFSPPAYGLGQYGDLFTDRQLVALTTFSDLVEKARLKVLEDATRAGMDDDGRGLADGGRGATAYADAVATYLAFAVDRSADGWSSQTSWRNGVEATRGAFARQALPMVWDFAEANPFSNSSGNWKDAGVGWVWQALQTVPASTTGRVEQVDAAQTISPEHLRVFCTDPPYYDNIGYADLSDFFYLWLRRSLGSRFPQLFSTLLTPKSPELIASPYRFEGSREKARQHFEAGLGAAFSSIQKAQDSNYPFTVFYAFKQSEGDGDAAGVASTGWETMLEGLLGTGFSVTGTWPMRTERTGRTISIGTAALASSVLLVCRPRRSGAPMASRKEFVSALRAELPLALRDLQRGNIAPVDLAQASIGPGMGIFSRYSRVIEADGSPMPVRTALGLINQSLDELLAEQEGDFDAETRWAVAWFDQVGMDEGLFGTAETLSKAKNTAVNALGDAGISVQRAGKVRLLDRDELSSTWDPETDTRLTVWELVQHLIRRLENDGEESAADLVRKVGGLSEAARELAYRLFVVCERKGWAKDALAYNGLVVAWPEVLRLAAAEPEAVTQQRLELE
jgi:putative DNA methylase